MKKIARDLTLNFVQYVERHALLTLFIIALITALSALYSSKHFAINASFDGLIVPSASTQLVQR